jgi:predicted Zn-dependent protease
VPVFAMALLLAPLASSNTLKPSQQEQVRLGIQAAAEIRKQEKILPSSDPRVKTLRMVGMRLLACFHDRAPWQWSFDVIDSREINAFSLPGGATFFYTGLLDKLKTEDELAAVLGHEMTHVRREHWAKAYGDAEFRSITLGILLGVAHAGDDLYNATGLVNSLYTLKFSRGDETQADDGGFELMIKAGYNPTGMADVFQMLEDAQRGGADPEFFSDHPSDKHRVARIMAKIQATGVSYPAQLPLSLDGYDRYFPDFYETPEKVGD